MNKALDDRLFNQNEDYELDYVAGRFPEYKQEVKLYLKMRKAAGTIPHNSTHKQIYQEILSFLEELKKKNIL